MAKPAGVALATLLPFLIPKAHSFSLLAPRLSLARALSSGFRPSKIRNQVCAVGRNQLRMHSSGCDGPDAEYLEGPEGVFRGCIRPDAGRYVLYVSAGCPFAGRPWFIVKFYGLESSVQVVSTFPANGEDSWFFKPVSDWEKRVVEDNPHAAIEEDPIMGVTHLKDLYATMPDYKGRTTLPLLYDKQEGSIISNDSMGMAKALCGRGMRKARTRNQEVELLPAQDDIEGTAAMDSLITELHNDWTTKVYKIHATPTQAEHAQQSTELFATLAKLESRLQASSDDDHQRWLIGNKISFADMLLFSTAIRFDLAYRWRFNIGGDSIQGGPSGSRYPAVWSQTQRIMCIEGVSGEGGAIQPADIMVFFWLSVPLRNISLASNKNPVPMLPSGYTRTGMVECQ